MSTRSERTDAIAILEEEFTDATGIYLTDFNRIDVQRITKFRTDLRNCGSKYIVVKNSLARIALEKCGFGDVVSCLKGQTGIAVTKEDAVQPAKVIKEFRKINKNLLELRIASVDGTVFNAEEASRLADLPSRDVLLSQLLSCLTAPMSNFVGALSGVFTKLTGTLEAVKNKKESEN